MRPLYACLAAMVALVSGYGWQGRAGQQTPVAPVHGSRSTRSEAERLAHVGTDERIRSYEAMLGKAPDDQQVEIGLLAAYMQKLRESGDAAYLDRATKLVSRMLEKDGGNATALRFQNEIDLQRHDFQAVAARAGSMAKYNPSDAGNWGNLGDALMDLGDHARAGDAYRRMFSLRPNLGSYNRLAYWRFVGGDGAGAIALMREAIEAGDAVPENMAWCLAELGDFYFKLGNVPAAAAAYNSGVALFPRLHRAYAGLGRVAASEGRTEEATKQFEHAQSIVPLVDYAAALEDLYTAQKEAAGVMREQELIDAIEKLTRAAGEKTNRNLALVLADHGRDLDFALALMETEVPTRGDVYSYDALAWVLLKNQRLAEAEAASERALQLGTPEPLFYYHAEKIAAALGDAAAAQRYSSRLASLNPRFDFAKCGPLPATASR